MKNQVLKNKRICIVHVGDFIKYPPVISLVENLLHNEYSVDLVSCTKSDSVPEHFVVNSKFNYHFVSLNTSRGLFNKIKRNFIERKKLISTVETCMKNDDFLWTTTDVTVKILGKMLYKYKHIMQLMELSQRYPGFINIKFFDFPIQEYAKKAYKVVVPDVDRAYIQQAWWELSEVPIVLPNKPYSLNSEKIDFKQNEAIEKIKNEKRKVILYTGIITPERNIADFAKSISNRDDYCLYIIGSSPIKNYIDTLLSENKNIEYLGYYPAPIHLEFLKYAYVGLTPYIPTKSKLHPVLNALYCAPNKIFEYAAYGVPMIGTDVLGLKRPFEQYCIGVTCKTIDSKNVSEALEIIDNNYKSMVNNCNKFYDSINLDEIVKSIIEQ